MVENQEAEDMSLLQKVMWNKDADSVCRVKGCRGFKSCRPDHLFWGFSRYRLILFSFVHPPVYHKRWYCNYRGTENL